MTYPPRFAGVGWWGEADNPFERIQVMAESIEQLHARIASLTADNQRLEASVPKPRTLTLKVSAKGAVQLNGLRRFPTTLYKDEWLRLFDEITEAGVRGFIAKHDAELRSKGDPLPDDEQ